MSLFKEFKEFAMRGNLVDMAVAVVVGTSFAKVVSAFIDGMVMPLIGMLSGGLDFNDKKFILKEPVAEIRNSSGAVISQGTAEIAVKYGTFITITIEFLLIAFVVFMVIKAINKMKRKGALAPVEPTKDQQLLMEIRDLLKR